MTGTLVEISGQKLSTRLLRLESACSLSEGCVSFSIASSPPAELTIVAAIIAAAQSLRKNLGEKEGSQTLTGRRGERESEGLSLCNEREWNNQITLCIEFYTFCYILVMAYPTSCHYCYFSDLESLFCLFRWALFLFDLLLECNFIETQLLFRVPQLARDYVLLSEGH